MFLTPFLFFVAGVIRDGILPIKGGTIIARLIAVIFLMCGAMAMRAAGAIDGAPFVALAFIPGIFWSPWHGRTIRFGEDGRWYVDKMLWAMANSVILTLLPAALLIYSGEYSHAAGLVIVGALSKPTAYYVGWWMQRRGWLSNADGAKFPPTRFGHSVWFLGMGIGILA